MTHAQVQRWQSLLPNGTPRYLRVYDNGGESADRYTAVYSGRIPGKLPGWGMHKAMSAAPFHPQGVSLWCENRNGPVDSLNGWPPAIGRKCHIGRRITFDALPVDCQRIALADYLELWGLVED